MSQQIEIIRTIGLIIFLVTVVIATISIRDDKAKAKKKQPF